ncbi:Uncharacterised protein [uncultured archaeon]|nr:Uncharacterised protein [uncultured archaeon]
MWCECSAWRRLPSWLCVPVNIVYNAKRGGVDRFYGPKNRDLCVKRMAEHLSFDGSVVSRLESSSKAECSKLNQVAADLGGLDFSSLTDDVIHKVYSIVLSQYSEACKHKNMSILSGKDSRLAPLSMALLSSEIDSSLSDARTASGRMFDEICKRVQRKREFVDVMTPEEMHYALGGGSFEEWEVEQRIDHYILVYDVEKDDPHAYSGEKSRTMEALFGFKGNVPKPSAIAPLDRF